MYIYLVCLVSINASHAVSLCYVPHSEHSQAPGILQHLNVCLHVCRAIKIINKQYNIIKVNKNILVVSCFYKMLLQTRRYVKYCQ